MKTPIFNLHDVIILLTIAVTLLLALFQWLLSKQKALVSALLGGFFLCVGLGALGRLLLWNEYIHLENSVMAALLPYLLGLEQLGKGPLLYFYVVAITGRLSHNFKHYVPHLLPILIYCLIVMFDGIDAMQMRFSSPAVNAVPINHLVWLWNILKYVPVVYGLATVVVVIKYQTQLKNYYSELSLQGSLWLKILTLGFALNWLWSLLVHVSSELFTLSLTDSFGIIDNYLTFLLVNALFFHSLAHAHQLLGTQQKPKEIVPAQAPAPEVIEIIRQGMEQQELYLTANLNIEEFARQIGVHYREVSNIINKQFNTNFFEYVNQYRVARAKSMLRDPAFAHMTILDILLESGFNSKSSFHRFFKRYAGMSAAEYRKQDVVGD
jgi:AraC-like DNA-binding protein